MINHSLRAYKCSSNRSVLLYATKLAITQTFEVIMQCDVTPFVICILNDYDISTRKAITKISQRSYAVNLSDLCHVN